MNWDIVKNEGIDPARFERILEINQTCPFHRYLGLNLASVAPGQASVIIKVQPEHANLFEYAHGGIASALADTAMGMAIRSVGYSVVTVEMNINYIAGAKVGQTLTATATVLNIGKNIIVAETEVRDENNSLIAKARCTFFIRGQIWSNSDVFR
ncbi:MAG: PaaI family thioesterase [Firmicutes bacterium]|nr:PaaI family thioesterase [Bacillota bacterium]